MLLRRLLDRLTPDLPTPPPPPAMAPAPATDVVRRVKNSVLADAWQHRLDQQAAQLAADLADLSVELSLDTTA